MEFTITKSPGESFYKKQGDEINFDNSWEAMDAGDSFTECVDGEDVHYFEKKFATDDFAGVEISIYEANERWFNHRPMDFYKKYDSYHEGDTFYIWWVMNKVIHPGLADWRDTMFTMECLDFANRI